jgi:uncharacterized membrane protein YedE/YeeE
MIQAYPPVSGFIGGILIGLAAVLLLVGNGRIAGVSGIVGGLLRRASGDVSWRVLFLVGLWLGALVYGAARGRMPEVQLVAPWPFMLAAGFLVGFGTRMSGGCTSGHGVCGIARLSKRSVVATVIFMMTAIATVFVTRYILY